MELKYKLIGVSDYAEKHLYSKYLIELKEFIGEEIKITESKAPLDSSFLWELPNGHEFHERFLIIESI